MDKFDCHIKGNQRNPSRRTFQSSLRIEISLNLIFHYEKCRQVNLILPQYQYLDFYLNSMYLRFRFSIKILSNYLVSRLDILTTHLVSTIHIHKICIQINILHSTKKIRISMHLVITAALNFCSCHSNPILEVLKSQHQSTYSRLNK